MSSEAMQVKEAAPRYLAQVESQDVPQGYKRTEVGVLPEDWEVRPLHSVVTFSNGKAHEGSISDFGKYVVVNSKFISTNGEVQKYTNKYLSPASKGDILMVMSDVPNGRAIARCYLVDRDNYYTVNQRICALRPTHVDWKLLYYKLDRNPYYLSFDDGVKQTNLRKVDVLSCPLSLPTAKAEQRAIAEALSDVDGLIGAQEALIAKKRAIKQAAMQQLLAGLTRLPGFSGEWETKRLGNVLDRIIGGGTPSRTNPRYWGNEIPWVTVKDFATFDSASTQESITREGLKNSASNLIPAGTVIVSTRMAVGKAVIYNIAVAINQDLKALFPITRLRCEYLLRWLEYNARTLESLGSGSTVMGISLAELKNLEIDLPSVEEQSAIATVLSDMDADIATLEARRDKTHAIKQGMMQQLLTGRVRLVKPPKAKAAC